MDREPSNSKINLEKTSDLQAESKWINYKQWLIDNNCRFPNLDFPVAFGQNGITGVMAKSDIPCKKAFLFVPFDIIITPQLAKESSLKVLYNEFPSLFKDLCNSWDYILWIFLMHEKFKGCESSFFPYISIIDNPELLSDWSREELQELQDPFLIIKAHKSKALIQTYYTSLQPVFNKYPLLFDEEPNLFNSFKWAYKVVTSRAFSQNEGMLIPLADSLNHEDVCVDYITLPQEFLLNRSYGQALLNDYKDFSGLSGSNASLMKTRTHQNRLEKYLSWFDNERIRDMNAIWEIDQILCDLESSTDQEDPVHEWTSDESSESLGDDFDMHFDPREKYFVMRTKENGSFKAGEQVFNCYGRFNNFDLLLDYGFSLWRNRYDSVHLRIFNCKLLTPTQKVGKKQVKTYNLKYRQANLKLLKALRKKTGYKSKYSDLNGAAEQEIAVINRFQRLIEEAYQIYPTLLEYDIEKLHEPAPARQKFALKFRISQKEILLSQLSICSVLLEVLNKIQSGETVRNAHWAIKTSENCRGMYPIREYLYKLEYGELW